MNIYILDFGNKIKIGQSDNIKKRIRDIETISGHEISNKFVIEAHGKYESIMHKILSEYRGIGEYFDFPFNYAVSILKSIVKFDFVHLSTHHKQLSLPLIVEKALSVASSNGYTLTEMSKMLGLPQRTIERRIQRAGIRPFTREAIYPQEALEAIKETKMGRPKKQAESENQQN